jgi:lambda repressor-like predicted transcriptional regulator
MINLEQEKSKLRRKGWAYRRLAAELGVTYQYLSDVLNGHRASRRLIARIVAVPKSPKKWGARPKHYRKLEKEAA